MINRWFRGTLGKVAGFGYALGTASLIASLMVAGTSAAGHAAPVQQSGSVGICHATPADTAANGWISQSISANGTVLDSQHNTQHDMDIIPSFTWTDNSGTHTFPGKNLTTDFGGFTGQQILDNGCAIPTPPTSTASNTSTNTPVDPTDTPTDTPDPVTDTPTTTPLPPTSTPSLTATNTARIRPTRTATNTPTNTSTTTLTPSPTNTPEPGVTPTETNTPTNTATPTDTSTATSTPTNTPQAPNLVDPKEDSLLNDNDGNGVPSPGDVLLYTMTISNTGESAATGVVFSDSPDSNTSLVAGSVTTTQGTVTSGNSGGNTSVAVDIGTIGAGETVTITFQVTINLGIPSSVTSVANQGLVSGGNIGSSFTDDPDTAEADDPTVTELFFPTATPVPTTGPGPTNTPVPATTPSVLIPVTGVELPTTTGAAAAAGILQNVGLGLLGLSLVVHSFSLGRKEDD